MTERTRLRIAIDMDDTMADAIRVTLGPRSKCVLIDKKWGRPLSAMTA